MIFRINKQINAVQDFANPITEGDGEKES